MTFRFLAGMIQGIFQLTIKKINRKHKSNHCFSYGGFVGAAIPAGEKIGRPHLHSRFAGFGV